jgi:SRSO17 transposase
MLGAALYLPETWLTADARQQAGIPVAIQLQEKLRLALALLRQIRAAGFGVTALLGDAEFGDHATLRPTWHQLKLPCKRANEPHPKRLQVTDGSHPKAVRPIAAQLPARAWRRVTWRNGTNRPWPAHFTALRVTPATDWRARRLAPEVGVLFGRDWGTTPRVKAYLVDVPPTASLGALVRLAHLRWAIEQQYQELKDELRLDHVEGRSRRGWHRHVALTALAYAWLQNEHRRAGARLPKLPVVRAVITEILASAFFRHAAALLRHDAETQGI